MDSVFHLIKNTLDQYREDCAARSGRQERAPAQLRLKNKGLLTVFVDKVVKILHIAMLHPQDYSVDLISKFIFEKPIISSVQEYSELEGVGQAPGVGTESVKISKAAPGHRNWLYLIDMFGIIEQYNQTMASEEIKLALIRFIAEFLIQTAHFSVNYLDDLIDVKAIEQTAMFDQGEFNTYGAQLFIEFAKVFKALYVSDKPRREELEAENFQKDICLCLNVLFSSCQSAKSLAVE